MSEPDVLDQVRVWFPAVPGAGHASTQTVSGHLPLSDALELIQMYCFIQPDFITIAGAGVHSNHGNEWMPHLHNVANCSLP